MRNRPTAGRPSRRLMGVVGVAAAALVVSTLGLSSGPAPAPPAAAESDDVPSLLVPAPRSEAAGLARPLGVQGDHRLVTLETSLLPARAANQRLRLPMAGGAATIELTSVEHEDAYTAWRGQILGQPLGTFTLVRAGDAVRAGLNAPGAVYSLTDAGEGRYWWTEVAVPELDGEGSDAVVMPSAAKAPAAAPRAAGAPVAKPKRRGKVKVGVLFGYTKSAKAEFGSRAAAKAAAALIVDQTNQAMKNSRTKVKIKMRGVIKAKGKDTRNLNKSLRSLYRPRDGRWDNLAKKRKRKRGDLVHLIQGGAPTSFCGLGYIPRTPREARYIIGNSVSIVSCLPILTATHEIGHNLGADHDKYAGVTHFSKMKGSYGFAYPAGAYVTVMSYYNACVDAGVVCTAIPWFSSPKITYNGQPLGAGKKHNNSKVIKKIAPRVARYVR